jgi:hypothetical protein
LLFLSCAADSGYIDVPQQSLPKIVRSDGVATGSTISVGASSDQGETSNTSFITNDAITLTAKVYPDVNDVGEEGELYVVLRTTVNGEKVFSALNDGGVWEAWNASLKTLPSAVYVESLEEVEEILIYSGTMTTGERRMYVAYSLFTEEGKPVITTSLSPFKFEVTLPGRWRTESLEWIQYNFNQTEKFCDDPQGVCAGWTDTASQDCKDNYTFGILSENTEFRQKYEKCINDIVFKPYVSKSPSRLIQGPLQVMVANAVRLQALGWDTPSLVEPVFVAASDVPSGLIDELKKGLSEAEKYLGRWGPLRVYVVGNLLEPALPVINDFCQKNYTGESIDYCINIDQGKDMREMATIYPGSNGFEQSSYGLDKPISSYALNPSSDSENLFSWSSGVDPDMEGSVLAHEYFHVYQGRYNIYRGGNESTPVGWGMPRWFEESAATYFQIVLGEKLGWQFRSDMDQQMKEVVNTVFNFRNRFPGVSIEDLETEAGTKRLQSYCQLCYGQVQYDYGLIGIRMLALKTSDDTVFFNYYKASKVNGWMKAFEIAFGLTVDQFYQELESLLRKPIPEQIEALKRK